MDATIYDDKKVVNNQLIQKWLDNGQFLELIHLTTQPSDEDRCLPCERPMCPTVAVPWRHSQRLG